MTLARAVDGDNPVKLSPVLRSIVDHKREEIRHASKLVGEAGLVRIAEKRRGDFRSLHSALSNKGDNPGIIAEIKRASPSTMFRPSGFNPASIALGYEKAGASAISVITEARFFCGSPSYLPIVREVVALPALRKDFIVDRWQVAETAAIGADAILLMTVNFDNHAEFEGLFRFAVELGLEPLVEIHSEVEWESIRSLSPRLVGINNRDFRSPNLPVDLEVSERLAPIVSRSAIVISESGIGSAEEIRRLEHAGAGGFLIGSKFMRESDPGAALAALVADWRKAKGQ